MWKDLTLCGSNTDFSIMSTCSLSVYSDSAGFGLLPNPRRSTAKNRYIELASSEKFGNSVSVQNADEEMKPWMNTTSSRALPPGKKKNRAISARHKSSERSVTQSGPYREKEIMVVFFFLFSQDYTHDVPLIGKF